MTEAARLVDELTTLLYEVIKRWQLPDGRVCEIVRCGACRRKADRAESVVHGSDCPVYRLIRAEEANTAVIRANADEIADLEDRRDELEGRVNALTAEMECRNELSREVARLQAQLAERDAEIARLKLTTRSAREYAEMKQRAEEAERQVARLVSERDVYRDSLLLISRGVWTARNSVESIVWSVREALKKGAALAARGGAS